MSDPTTLVPQPLLPVKKIKQLPGEIITHMPFIIFKPMEVIINGNKYVPMVFLYFSRNLDILATYPDNTTFDSMPEDNVLSFSASFNKGTKYTVLKNTYYFAPDLATNKLGFMMSMTENTVNEYNKANPTNPIHGGFSEDGTENKHAKTVQFINAECDVIIPPFPPT